MTTSLCASADPCLALAVEARAAALPADWAGLAPAVFLAVLVALALWRIVLRLVIAAIVTALVVGLLLLGTHLGPADGSGPGGASTSDGPGR